MRIQNPAWETLRRVGQSRVVSFTVLMPFVGYMILLNDHLVDYLKLSSVLVPADSTSLARETVGSISKATRDRLYFIYFGLTSLGVGSLLYSIFCPRIQKEHSSDFTYIREEIGLMTERRAMSAIEFLKRRRTAVIAPHMQTDLESLTDRLNPQISGARESEMATKELMLMLYQSENWWNPSARLSVALFFSAGFICLAIPSVQVFASIVANLIK